MMERWYRKGLVIGIIALFVGFGFQPVFANDITQESENVEKLQFWWIFVHVKEIYGTLDDPQYRPLPNVTVKIKVWDLIFWRSFWSGKTDKNGDADVPIIDSLCYKVMVSKEGYHTYKCLPVQKIYTGDYFFYDVYFTMAEDGSPFNETKSTANKIEKVEDCDCQTVFPDIKEIFNLLNYKIVNNRVYDNFGYCLILYIQTAISVYLAEIFHFISQEYPEDSIIYKIFNNLAIYYMNRFYRLIDIGDDNDCWWIPGPPPDS